MNVEKRGSPVAAGTFLIVATPLPQLFWNVLILINYQPAIEAIQTHGRINVIDSAIRAPSYGNPWLDFRAIFTFAGMIGPERILLTRLSDLHETLTDKVLGTWGIHLPDAFFTFRFKDAGDQTYDVPLNTQLYPMLELHRPQWNRQQHVERPSTYSVRFRSFTTVYFTSHRSP